MQCGTVQKLLLFLLLLSCTTDSFFLKSPWSWHIPKAIECWMERCPQLTTAASTYQCSPLSEVQCAWYQWVGWNWDSLLHSLRRNLCLWHWWRALCSVYCRCSRTTKACGSLSVCPSQVSPGTSFLPKDVSSDRYMLRDEVPNVLSAGLPVLVSVEDLQQIVQHTFVNILSLEACLFVICQESQSIFYQ